VAELTANERAALARIELLEAPGRLRAMIANARRQGASAVEAAAFRRLCHVQPEATPGTVEHDVWQSIHALEQMLREERGKTVRLSRTRQKIARDGAAKAAADLTLKRTPSEGFHQLVAKGHPELLFETVVLRHPKTFDAEVTRAARARLETAGLDPDTLMQANNGG